MKQDFKRDLQIGQAGEQIVLSQLSGSSVYKNVRIVNQKGHDIIAEKVSDNKEIKFEVKKDSYLDTKSDNFVFEIYSNVRVKNPGWVYYGDADVLTIVSDKKIYMMNFTKAKQIVNSVVDYDVVTFSEPRLKKNIGKITTSISKGNIECRSLVINKKYFNEAIIRIFDR